MPLTFTSAFIETSDDHQLHLMEIVEQQRQDFVGVILMVHGMIEDGRIFYHPSGKGLGSYLAEQGYKVFVADLRGIGRSRPAINKNSLHGQHETICQDIPLLINHCAKFAEQQKIHLVTHSWGGVFVNSTLVRFPQLLKQIASASHFGSKRSVRAKTFDRLLKIEFFWKLIAVRAAKKNGYLNAIKYKIGSDNETQQTLLDTIEWIKSDHWIDGRDGFNYQQAADLIEQQDGLPAMLYYAAPKDYSLGYYQDVQRFMQQSGAKNAQYKMLSKAQGYKMDYDHLDMLTSPQGITDHFPQLLEFMQKNSATPL